MTSSLGRPGPATDRELSSSALKIASKVAAEPESDGTRSKSVRDGAACGISRVACRMDQAESGDAGVQAVTPGLFVDGVVLPLDCNACRMSASRICDAFWILPGPLLPDAAVEDDVVESPVAPALASVAPP
jgi:hypothetical protein